MPLPLRLRNWLAGLILDAFGEPHARAVLDALGRYCQGQLPARATLPPGFPAEFFEQAGGKLSLRGAYRRFRDELCDRAARACALVRDRPLSDPEPSLQEALDRAASLFDARLHFEVHELLEPFWMRAEGAVRQVLQGLIQISVGFHHLGSNNVSGARTLLDEGRAKLEGQRLEGIDLGAFAGEVRRTLETIVELGPEAPGKFDWGLAPKFPCGSQDGKRSTPR